MARRTPPSASILPPPQNTRATPPKSAAVVIGGGVEEERTGSDCFCVNGQRRIGPTIWGAGIGPVVQVQGQCGTDASRSVGADLADDQVVAARHKQSALVPRVAVAPADDYLAGAHVQRPSIFAKGLTRGHGHEQIAEGERRTDLRIIAEAAQGIGKDRLGLGGAARLQEAADVPGSHPLTSGRESVRLPVQRSSCVNRMRSRPTPPATAAPIRPLPDGSASRQGATQKEAGV